MSVKRSAYAHFIGIGGAGMSALALVLAQRGICVTGSDMKESRYCRSVRDAGMDIHIGHDEANLGDPEVVVVSTAIPENNPELVAARVKGIEIWPRAQMLAHLAGDKSTIAVAGTHGKTSTSSMIASMLRSMGLHPSFCVGGEVDGINANAEHGDGSHYVVEADESDGSFVYLTPDVAIVTNLEADHMDHYDSFADIEAVFVTFLKRIPEGGCAIVCGDDDSLVKLAHESAPRVVTYGSDEDCDYRYVITDRTGLVTRFDIVCEGDVIASSSIGVPGDHMVANAAAALVTARILGLDISDAALHLKSFSGVRRRFDHIGEVGGITVVDDYGHHPTELAATLGATRSLGYTRTVALFQPHRYTRTEAFAVEFGEAFDDADIAVLMDVYSAGETPIPGISGRTIVESILSHNPRAQVGYMPHRTELVEYLRTTLRPGDLLMTMGAGDVTTVGPELIRALEG